MRSTDSFTITTTMFLSSLATGFTTGAGLIVCIGSQNAFVLRQGLLRSHVGLVAAVCIVSDVVLIAAGVSGLGFIVEQWPHLLQWVRYAGALFLGFNALQAARRAFSSADALNPSQQTSASRQQILLSCLAFTWLNPHVYLDTVFMLGSLSLQYQDGSQWQFGFGAMLASVAWFVSITYGARLLLPLFKNPNAWRVLDGLVGLVMAYLCLGLVLTPLG
ncbi:L-lysine exporter family protein LysE/ArgO [Vibrio xiamenensis]|uniref:L-lysine exporter family protein LysE/ArgO n=1 Tax=Vibrio xiamenensis TaxID=861298 RepID=A0A1G7XLT4_9VIBR|nr:LysE/ArgO family amino acid transporter [Vibrio xiamenensis]SDG85122.1 L-lysine exporter family protein LysE/ArgO [Vibrio xiamenensis]